MKISFINPTLGGDYSALDIAITVLASCVNEWSNHRADILDFTFHRRDWRKKLNEHIKREKPDFIGFSVNSLYLNHIKMISQEVKRIDSKIKIIYGGYHASTHPEELVELPYVDFVFVGDAEDSLIDFLNKQEKGLELDKIKGLWYYNKDHLISNPGSFYSKLDELPYLDWDLWEHLDDYLYFLGMLYQIGTRGCIYNCSFCEAKELRNCVLGNYYRVMSPKRYAEELAYDWQKYRKRGLRLMQLFDQIPALNKEWLKEFTEEYKRLVDPKNSKYSIFSRVDNLDEEKIRMLASSGCNMVRIGIESGDKFIRNKVMRKGLPEEKIWEVVGLLKKYGIKMTAYYILGAPAESKETINKTIEMAGKIDAERSAFFIFKPFTKESEELVKRYGGTIDFNRANKADNITFDAVVNNKNLSAKEVERYQIKAYMKTFLPHLRKRILRDNFKYFGRLFKYVFMGIKKGLSFKYLLTYFHIYGYDYIYE